MTTKRDVLAFIASSVGTDVFGIADHFQLNRPAAGRHVIALLEERLIEWVGAVLQVTQRGRDRLAFYEGVASPSKTIRFRSTR